MCEWKEYRLSDITDFIDYRGKTPKKTSHGIPLITAKIVKNGRIEVPTEYISPEDYPKWMVRGFPKVGDVVLTTEAPLGEVAQIKDASFALAQRIITLRGKRQLINNGFLKYFLQSKIGQNRLKERETGTTVTGIKSSELKKVIITLPDYVTQTAIAEILSSLDDKIELNNKINNELEALAQALFKQWFIDFEFPNENGEPYKSSGGEMVESELGEIPKGWRVDFLETVLDIKYGKDHKKLNDGEIPVYGSGGIMRYVNNSIYDKESILIPRKGTLKNLFYINKPFWTVDTIFYTVFKNKKLVKYIYYILKQLDLASMNVGSAVPSMTTKVLNNLSVILPQEIIIENFDKILTPIFESIYQGNEENEDLSKLRNLLLPKLISGELKLSEL
jgi:type I restriction enzyme S subunit